MRISRSFAASALIAGLIGLGAALAGPAGAASASPGDHRIGDYDGRTFATATTANNLVTMRAPSSGANQVWKFTQDSYGTYRMINRLTGGCLAVRPYSSGQNPEVVQRPCNGNPNERWQLVRTSSVHVAFRNVGAQGRCLTVNRYFSPARLFANPCNIGSTIQQFRLL
ncbi:MAG: RICIN domain-containing protein [Micromonosporaceae bacterium]